jgi:hypothetical protein
MREALPYFHQIGNYIALADCVIGLAWAAAERGQLEQAAHLLGAAEKASQTYGRKYIFEYENFYTPIREKVNSCLDGKYEVAVEEGRNTKMDDIVKALLAE